MVVQQVREKPSIQRYHSLDSLRAIMMSLGLVIHGAITYITPPPGGTVWAIRDPARSVVFDYTLIFIHVFRMPVFFVIAGFFAAYLFMERGEKSFIVNRLKRVLLPMAVFWPFLFVLTFGGVWHFWNVTGQHMSPDLKTLYSTALGARTFIHLWFLYDLLIFYAATLLVMRIPAPASLMDQADKLFRAALNSPFRALALGLVTVITLLPMKSGMLDTRNSYIPYLPTLAAYGVYFSLGWLLFRSRGLLDRFQDGAWRHTMFGLALFPVNFRLVWTVLETGPNPDPWIRAGAAVTSGIVMGFLVFGIIGLFLKYCSSYNRVMRYFTDASYWIYLVHLPLAVWVPALFVDWNVPAVVKFLMLEAIMITAVLVSYHYCVRSTFIGQMLNGKRYPRALPPPVRGREPAPARAAA